MNEDKSISRQVARAEKRKMIKEALSKQDRKKFKELPKKQQKEVAETIVSEINQKNAQ
jgi:hypothetical protein